MNAISGYMRQLHDFAGKRLYIYILLMLLISCLDGLSIYLLVPLLSLVGLFGAKGSMPMAWLFEPLQRIPASMTLFVVLGMYSVLMIVQGLIQRRQAVMGTEIQQGFVNNLRIRTYRSILRANWTFFLRKRKSDLSHVLTSELARVSQGTNLVLQLATSLIFMVIQIGFAMVLSVQMTLLVIVGGILLTLYSRKFVRRAKRMGDRTTFLSQEYFSGMQEHLNGIKDIKSNMLEASHFEWFRSMCGKLEQNAIQLVRLNSGTQFIYKIISVVFIIMFVVLSAQVFKLQPERAVLIINTTEIIL